MSEQAVTTKTQAPSHLYTVRVEDVRHYTERLFSFACERPTQFRFRSGEFVMIGLMDNERPLLRAYSIASPAWDASLNFYSIKVADGPLTSRLQHIRPGDKVYLGRKATGTLVLEALTPGRRLFLLSTGTGIAPFASLIREPETYERFDEVVLTHTCRTDRELDYSREAVTSAFEDPLVGGEARQKLRYGTSLTREAHPLEGRITNLIRSGAVFEALQCSRFDPSSDRIMICGSIPMLSGLKEIAMEAGFVEGSNHTPGTFVVERAFAG